MEGKKRLNVLKDKYVFTNRMGHDEFMICLFRKKKKKRKGTRIETEYFTKIL